MALLHVSQRRRMSRKSPWVGSKLGIRVGELSGVGHAYGNVRMFFTITYYCSSS
jgi:hypothetical protein